YFILDEVPNALTLLGCALAIGAIYFINIYGKKA
ncbi:TPA: DMT family transporter, partial [Campylobacter jejuni]